MYGPKTVEPSTAESSTTERTPDESTPWGPILVLALALSTSPGTFALEALPPQTPGPPPNGMFELYEENREQGIPSYVTEDFLLLGYSMLVDETLAEIERERLAPSFRRLVGGLREELAGPADRDGVREANARFLAVVDALLQRDAPPPAPAGAVDEELTLVFAAKGFASSQILEQKIDYSQMRVRGRYTRDPSLARYFRAVRYAGTVLFPVVESWATGISAEAADRLTAQALQLVERIHDNPEIAEAYQTFDATSEWWLGPADDLGVDDYQEVVEQAGDAAGDLPRLRRRLLEHARQHGRQPRVLGGLVELDALEPGVSARDVLTGWRLVPQRFTPESAAFQELVHDRVGPYQGTGTPRTAGLIGGRPSQAFPSALELMALLGSEAAVSRLDATDERNYEGYADAAGRAQQQLQNAVGLAGRHLELLRFWLDEASGRPPAERRLNSALAFWTYQRYVGLLYTKQSYTGVSKGFSLAPKRSHAWLEPAAELYLRLAELARELGERSGSARLPRFAALLDRCVLISVRERAALDLTTEDVEFVNGLDRELFKLIGRRDAPIVVDVHTDPASAQVLQDGLGWPRVVEEEIPGGRARGVLLRHHELKLPMSERLNDSDWIRLLTRGELPDTEPKR